MTRVAEENQTVAPGEVVVEDEDLNPHSGVFVEGGKIRSKFVGTVEYAGTSVRVVPEAGRYVPSEGDIVIAEVEDVSFSSWRLDMDSPYQAMLRIDDAADEYIDLDEDELTDFYEVGDTVVAKVSQVTSGYDVNVSMMDERCRKLNSGRVVEIPPPKVPKVIGKQGRMVRNIKQATSTRIIVGENGLVWIEGEQEGLAARAVEKAASSHQQDLHEQISDWIEQRGESL
jgi:exosome complex component RRP4